MSFIQDAPALTSSLERKIKAHLPIKFHKLLVNYDENATPKVPSKYSIDQEMSELSLAPMQSGWQAR